MTKLPTKTPFFLFGGLVKFYIHVKKEPMTYEVISQVHRLCVYASGSLITDIFSSLTHISVSCLHFGQNSGKFLSTVSMRIFVRVLLLQIGQLIHSIIIQQVHCSRNDWQEHLCPYSRYKYFPLVPKPVHQNRYHFSG